MNKKSGVPWWGWLVWLIAAASGAAAYDRLPDRVPVHFNAAGETDRYGSRFEAVAIVPAIMLGIILLWLVLWRIDPKRRNYEGFWPTYRYMGGVIIVFMALIHMWSLGKALDISQLSSIRLLPTLVGAMLLLLSNVLPRLQPNWWLGIRTAWTLSSTESWTRTHRLAGHLGIPTAAVIIALGWILPVHLVHFALIGPLAVWVLISVTASYFYAK